MNSFRFFLFLLLFLITPKKIEVVDAEQWTSSGYCQNCGFNGYKYQWCNVGKSWDYCSTKPGHTTRNGKCRPDHKCGYHEYSYLWCYTSDGSWDYCSVQSKNELERIVNSIDYIRDGVTVDYRYNQSTPADGSGFISALGCPKSLGGFPWLLYGSPPRCYLTGHQYPCAEDEIFFAKPGSLFGTCVCECFADKALGSFDFETTQICPYAFDQPKFFYDASSMKCLQLYEQVRCQQGQWLVEEQNNTNILRCEERKCPKNSYPKEAFDKFLHRNSSVDLSRFLYEPKFDRTYKGRYNKDCMQKWISLGNLGRSSKSVFCDPSKERYSRHLKRCIKKIAKANVG